MKYTLDEFKNVWNGSSANDILNQFYYEHIELQKALERIANLQIDNNQLTNNWNELEEWLESNWKDTQDIWYVKIINKMKEIKEGKNVSDRD